MKENMKERYLLLSIIATLVLYSGGITYAYWSSTIEGTGANMNATLDVNGAKVIFTDTQEITSTNARPGWNASKTFTIENTNTVPFTYDIYIENLINTLVTEDFLQYQLVSENGYNMTDYASIGKSPEASNFDLATSITIPAKTKQTYTFNIRYVDSPDVDQSEDKGKSFSGRLMIRESNGSSANPNSLYAILTNGKKYPIVKSRTDFNKVPEFADINTSGIIYKEDTYRENDEINNKYVYYFYGVPEDNWVKFGKEGENDIYWRIIRTNEDGSVRLLYAGLAPDTTSGYINGRTYTYSINSNTYSNTMYVGWTYGDVGSLENNRNGNNEGAVKTALDKWFETNLKTNYGKYIEENAIYCNDRSGDEYYSSGTNMYYASYSRLITAINKQPTYKCGENSVGGYTNSSGSWISKTAGMYSDASKEDKYTVRTATVGNKRLKYPVGLMTADEVSFAGGNISVNATNTYYYLNSTGESVTGNVKWWTMSPCYYSASAYMFHVYGSGELGRLNYSNITVSLGVRPVISIKSNVLVSKGNGTANFPYELGLN